MAGVVGVPAPLLLGDLLEALWPSPRRVHHPPSSGWSSAPSRGGLAAAEPAELRKVRNGRAISVEPGSVPEAHLPFRVGKCSTSQDARKALGKEARRPAPGTRHRHPRRLRGAGVQAPGSGGSPPAQRGPSPKADPAGCGVGGEACEGGRQVGGDSPAVVLPDQSTLGGSWAPVLRMVHQRGRLARPWAGGAAGAVTSRLFRAALRRRLPAQVHLGPSAQRGRAPGGPPSLLPGPGPGASPTPPGFHRGSSRCSQNRHSFPPKLEAGGGGQGQH